ncbi:Rrf2 family transcriptional regulator [Lactiplantibacillus mudanjiangensis]|uniref:Putative HTH-type transcriptional regulator ywnA [Lactobacillus brevis KB290] n=1 Tax=Lactiplantibacillus mudanjiangensis TaxID=1296538 RepID=A0A660E2W9_9LACO|nr:Rrf2 family transcriptional regulator [Lactiplantibacillus mudanjiangensis]VDG20274.1 putative HTH-type transcriptional regulator ywnA [Lactobacillus brevis KB290] [Lactiplantibacillus mudanjiangensis]VDG24035.1 putative HTH-type transcriptional regulator ywnA [Lactobacillus brevis KB290] [Lactiplantibacillus mudanjiangensis]VDG27280.1 putative HTH-type transcriptional regulator ywnA [Lactobacillus brevis KB290] [Lactiplantibacillus mudanjiangensis]VDG33868.1 putative HTH-type transcriptiona
MKYSYKLSDAIHILAYVSIVPAGNLSSATIAESIESNASVVRRLMANLKEAGLLASTVGAAKPHLAKPATEITLLDVFKAVETNHDILHVDPRTNMDCPVGANIQQTLNEAYAHVQNAAEAEMQAITVQSIIDGIQVRRQEA